MDQGEAKQKNGTTLVTGVVTGVDITSLKVSIRALKRNLSKLKNRTGAKVKAARERTERKIAAKLKQLEAAGPVAKRKKKKNPEGYSFTSYVAYINSNEWAARRRDYFSRHTPECRACGANHGVVIHLHHVTYERLYREPDDDLMPLCKQCHTALHKLQRSRKVSVTEATKMWLSRK